MSIFNLFKSHSKSEQADSISAYLPNDRLFEAKNVEDTNLRKFIEALSFQLTNFEEVLNLFVCNLGPLEAVDLLPEWESMVGIPDDCFSGSGPIAIRQRDVLIKLASLGIQTEQDFINLAALFGVDIQILQGGDVNEFPLTFPFLFLSEEEAKFTIIVQYTEVTSSQFPLVFPFTFGDPRIEIIECLFNKLKPANVVTIFEEI